MSLNIRPALTIPTAPDEGPRQMPAFARLLLGAVILAVAATLVFYGIRTHQIKFREVVNATHERGAVEQIWQRINHKSRRADMVVGTQVLGGDRKVKQTTLVFQRYGLDADGISSLPLPPQVITIAGDAVVIEIVALKFSPDLHFDDDFSNFSSVVAGKTINLFGRVYAEDSSNPGVNITMRSAVPASCAANPELDPGPFEKGLWHKIWDLAHNPVVARQRGLSEAHFASAPLVVKPGVVYRILIEGLSQPMVHTEEDQQEIATMLSVLEASKKPPADADH